MKNPLILFSALLGAITASMSLAESATLEFCYDHVTEDFSEAQQNEPLCHNKATANYWESRKLNKLNVQTKNNNNYDLQL